MAPQLPQLPPNTPDDVRNRVALVTGLSLSIDCPPVTALLKLEDDRLNTMKPELRAQLNAIDVDFRRRVYYSIVAPLLDAIGVKEPPQ